jgi:hypothetical protein
VFGIPGRHLLVLGGGSLGLDTDLAQDRSEACQGRQDLVLDRLRSHRNRLPDARLRPGLPRDTHPMAGLATSIPYPGAGWF